MTLWSMPDGFLVAAALSFDCFLSCGLSRGILESKERMKLIRILERRRIEMQDLDGLM